MEQAHDTQFTDETIGNVIRIRLKKNVMQKSKEQVNFVCFILVLEDGSANQVILNV